MKTYTLTEQVVNEVLAYLGTRPYVDVQGVIAKLATEIAAQDALKEVALTPKKPAGK